MSIKESNIKKNYSNVNNNIKVASAKQIKENNRISDLILKDLEKKKKKSD